jgi:prepilin-type N-terminal cleavage/methylation domain-containing protein
MSVRRGFSLIEMTVQIVVIGMVLSLGHTLLVGMLKDARPARHTPLLTDLACDRLRRDLAAGATVDDQALLAGGQRWTTDGQRNAQPIPGVRSMAWRQEGARWIITVTPPSGPVRIVAVTP